MMSDEKSLNSVLKTLQDPRTIRKQAERMLSLAHQEQLEHFAVDNEQMSATAAFVLDVIHDQYPTLEIPYHSRWRHFTTGGIDRVNALTARLHGLSQEEQGKIFYELVIISVFLDAGAGNYWRYLDSDTGHEYNRSEGLAIASLALYLSGVFSNDPNQPWRVDYERLLTFAYSDLTKAFQLTNTNVLEGAEGRVALLNRLGMVISKQSHYFGKERRLGNFYSYISSLQVNQTITASQIFQAVLTAFAEVWPARLQVEGVPLGDVWYHPKLKTDVLGSELIPFHKLSQWLTYSLVEPLEWGGIKVTRLDDLTGLPEYRNGGLLIDMGLLRVKNKALFLKPHSPGAEAIVEWRALTVALLDELATTIRQQLQMDAVALPLAKILQGGTWEAGRRIAKLRRSEGNPPIQIISDGTVF
ncbi:MULTISPECIES: URC4/urg3 family protein [unclassified Legionella]|uniref:URC4/urg3 family protein n=1 Tax=unclassified Legionella TaxID=2622702 RepID=UPI001E431566|nr:URC4/urg3 family protein [Legionella sp. 31fI33]MCC5015187.1 URC4/urg3 family protein [Legionella sp. 31fI33]